jgi:hypothetical protein
VRHDASHRAARWPRGDPAAAERLERALEVGALSVRPQVDRAAVAVGVVADLVARRGDPLDGLRVAVRREPGHEERGAEPEVGEHLEDARHAHARPVGLVGHDHGVLGVAPPGGEDRRLGVHVEGQDGHGRPVAAPARGRQRTRIRAAS